MKGAVKQVPKFVTVRLAKYKRLPLRVWNADETRLIAAFSSERQLNMALGDIIRVEAEAAGYEVEKPAPRRWTKADLEYWAQSWSRTPETVLQAFIDAGFCSEEPPARDDTRLI